jgi:hypothetical protein
LTLSISHRLRQKIEKLADVTTRPMFGYDCYSVNGKFFVGFSKENQSFVIVRLSKELQQKAIQEFSSVIRPFSHGARMGWIELDASLLKEKDAFGWIEKGYAHVRTLS